MTSVPHISAKPLKWKGFEPKAYVLDMEKVWKLPLKVASSSQEMTIGRVVEAFRGDKVEVDDEIIELTLKTDSKNMVIKGPRFNRALLELLYRFTDEQVSPFDVHWFYYDHDTCLHDPQHSYSFFLAVKERIITERFSLFESIDSGFDPEVLMLVDSIDEVWRGDADWNEAHQRYLYRKFYRETRTGQFMALRPDKPPLYYYPEGREHGSVEGWLSRIEVVLARIKLAIWVLVGLTLVELYLRWK